MRKLLLVLLVLLVTAVPVLAQDGGGLHPPTDGDALAVDLLSFGAVGVSQVVVILILAIILIGGFTWMRYRKFSKK